MSSEQQLSKRLESGEWGFQVAADKPIGKNAETEPEQDDSGWQSARIDVTLKGKIGVRGV